MLKVDFDIKIKAGFESVEIVESMKKTVCNDLKRNLQRHLKEIYGLDTETIEVELSVTKID